MKGEGGNRSSSFLLVLLLHWNGRMIELLGLLDSVLVTLGGEMGEFF